MLDEPYEEWPEELKNAYRNWIDAQLAEDALNNDWTDSMTHFAFFRAVSEAERTAKIFNQAYEKWEASRVTTPARG